jgi:type II secretory pathway component GspD/PulD (secretin)
LTIDVSGDRITLTAREAPLDAVLSMIAQQHGLSIVGSGTAGRFVTVNLADVALEDALDAILKVNGFTWTRDRNILLVAPLSTDVRLPAYVQGRIVRVFPLNFVAAADVDRVVQGLLSPAGKSFILESSASDKRRTREQIVVEDLPDSLERIAGYIAQADQPPRQVLIEAHVLRVDLKDETRHGVDINQLMNLSKTKLSLKTTGLANSLASPTFLVGVDAGDMGAVIEALKLTTDAKTLAAPRVLAVNGQQARIQIGEHLGYFVTTSTQTSTLQSVQFLDVGVVLNVTPVISEDGRVLMTVKPEVSNGRINATTGLPEEETTEVETTLMLADGQGMIIGGLIQERDSDTQSKIPLLGDIWGIGRLFSKTDVLRQRSEIIIALTTRLVPYGPAAHLREQHELDRVYTPLLDGPLRPVDRSAYEPRLADPIHNPRRLDIGRLPDAITHAFDERPLTPNHYFPTTEERALPGYRAGESVPAGPHFYLPSGAEGYAVPAPSIYEPGEPDVFYEPVPVAPPPAPR